MARGWTLMITYKWFNHLYKPLLELHWTIDESDTDMVYVYEQLQAERRKFT
jgi:hypothetical protein